MYKMYSYAHLSDWRSEHERMSAVANFESEVKHPYLQNITQISILFLQKKITEKLLAKKKASVVL